MSGSGETITVEPGNGIPVYVKDGAIIPMMPAVTKLTDQKAAHRSETLW
jgi:alpha-glucosidase (family GH31 glycosyl hydrolase)